jgi:hypothetical protein
MMDFSDWITNKYIEWRGRSLGRSGSVAEFARLFNASQPLMSQWMKKSGKVPTSQKYIHALVAQYGDEVYEVLGIAKSPDEQLSPIQRQILKIYNDLSPEAQARFLATLEAEKNGESDRTATQLKTKPA